MSMASRPGAVGGIRVSLISAASALLLIAALLSSCPETADASSLPPDVDGSPTEQDVGLESRKWGIFKHYAKKPTKEKKNPSGWFVGQNVNDNTPSTNYEDCNEACARYTKDIQDKGFKGSLVCNEEAISVMSSIVDDAGMSDALLARSSFSDPFPNEDISIVADDRTNIMNLGTVSPYFFTPVGSPMTQARYVQPGFAGPAGRADTTCTNAFTNGDVAVNRYCFCIYEK